MADASGSVLGQIRVLIVDEHAGVRSSLSTVLPTYDDLALAGEVADGQDAVRLCARIHPDIVLLDVTLPDMTCTAAIRAIVECSPACRVIATCTFQEEETIPAALAAGAVGYLLKNVSAEELASAIRAAHALAIPQARPPHGPEGK